MSDYKFVIYEALDVNAHTSRMLEEEHHGNVPTEITDKQLSSHHVGVKDTIMENLLEKTRTGAAEVILEKNLNDSKDQFGSKHRNPSAYEGDINKLEENWRKHYDYESVKYEPASETPKRQRWWEAKSKDGLKIASKKVAQSDDYLDQVDWDFVERDEDDLDDLDGLDGLDTLDDTMDDDLVVDDMEFEVDDLDDSVSDDVLEEVSYNEVDVGGTPTATGVIKVSQPDFYESTDDPQLESDLKDLMSLSHEDLAFSLSSFDFSKFSQGIITYQIGIGGENFEIDDIDDFDSFGASNFPIVEATKKK